MISFRSTLILLVILAAGEKAALRASESAEDELRGPVRVEMRDGRTYTGQPVAFGDGMLTLRIRIESGEVERGLPQEEIARLQFSGASVERAAAGHLADGAVEEALPHLEALWRQRAPLLALLEPERLELLSALPVAYLAVGDAYNAIALARRILPHATEKTTADRLQEAILMGHFDLEFYEETDELARAWIREQESFPDSALGWRILAELALLQEDFDRVLWVALQPVAIAGPLPVEHLDACYALAIYAYHATEARDQAARLYREMVSLNLPWPRDERFAATGELYHEALAKEIAGKPETPTPDLDLRPPEQDLNLPLRAVRKLLQADPL